MTTNPQEKDGVRSSHETLPLARHPVEPSAPPVPPEPPKCWACTGDWKRVATQYSTFEKTDGSGEGRYPVCDTHAWAALISFGNLTPLDHVQRAALEAGLLDRAARYLEERGSACRGTVCDDDKADGFFAMAAAIRRATPSATPPAGKSTTGNANGCDPRAAAEKGDREQ